MKMFRRECVLILLLVSEWLSGTALAQPTLSVERRTDGHWIRATIPPGAPFALQASANLRLWVDLDDAAQGEYSARLEAGGATKRFYRLVQREEPAPNIRVVILGDSTVADLAANRNLYHGWGQGMYGYFKPNAQVLNLALPGVSTKSFLESAEWFQTQAIKPNYVIAGFGLIDEFGADEKRTTLEEYGNNLRTIAQGVMGFGGTPILATPTPQKFFDDHGQVIRVYQERAAVTRQVAAELGVQCIDVNESTAALLNRLGPVKSEYLWYPGNYLHFSAEGARIIAGLLVNDLPPELGPYLTDIFDPLFER